MADNRYDVISWRGFRFDRYTVANILATERALGFVLAIAQGSYNAGKVSASAGTHDGGGAVDFGVSGMSTKTIAQVVKALRKQGFAAWYRPAIPGLWQSHIHAILVGNSKASSGAKSQVSSYRKLRNGLANNARDTSWRPLLIRSAPYKPVRLRFATFNLPGEDKIPNGAKRVAAAVKLIKANDPAFVGWNELVGIQRANVSSNFARSVDDALGAGWNLVKPTRLLNENYVSYQSKILKLVRQYDDSILESSSGGRHLTRAVFQVRGTDFVFAVGQLHLVDGTSARNQKDRQIQAADALVSMRAVTAKHGGCPFIIAGDFNMPDAPTAFVSAGMKNVREKADTSTTRNKTTFTTYAKTAPSTSPSAILDQLWTSGDFWSHGYAVRQDLKAKKFRKPRPSDHQPVVGSVSAI